MHVLVAGPKIIFARHDGGGGGGGGGGKKGKKKKAQKGCGAGGAHAGALLKECVAALGGRGGGGGAFAQGFLVTQAPAPCCGPCTRGCPHGGVHASARCATLYNQSTSPLLRLVPRCRLTAARTTPLCALGGARGGRRKESEATCRADFACS